ncbi:tetratricopeptide repeat protein [Candidatus Dojkabacteria bacterium]|uniref:Tetratricopeptide repeat protein n=1 Tax=Candidatus Dojkabacteria bacterium TaxID=2099670 RepID=A0A5C7J4A9_9BACT|nr:MAG: tetratricopeptide repeat protein [Candidatus Dojkabacteria bacterium]
MKVTSNQAIKATLAGDWDEAINLNKSLLDENPNDVAALNRIALAYMILGKNKNAKDSYQKVLSIDPLNSIAMKNLRKIKSDTKNGDVITIQVNNTFLEETGKTKVVELVNVAQSEILSSLRTGQSVELSAKRLKVHVAQGKKYIGALPDDIGSRLTKLIAGGNTYEAFIKSASSQEASIFIREVKRSSKFKDQASFVQVSEAKLKIKKRSKADQSEDED